MGKVDQGVVVLWMAKHFWNKQLGYFGFGGEGKQVRDMLHVHDLYRLLEIQLAEPSIYAGRPWNVGGGTSVSVSLQELTQICERITGNQIPITSVKENRVADIPWYITDATAIKEVSGWEPLYSVDMIMQDVYDWIKENSWYWFGPISMNRILGTTVGVAVAGTLSMPFDTVRTRMHTMRPLPNGRMPYDNSVDCFRKIL
jgi:dTDP-D-glucose 4,6-dehydratase